MILLDTHIFIWWIDGNKKLPSKYSDILKSHESDGLGVSVISLWEIVKLHEKSRLDFSCSIVTAAAAKQPDNRPFDGIDILRMIKTNQRIQKRTLFWRARRGQRIRKAVRDGSMKYIRIQDNTDIKEYLFDLEKDPAEKNNLVKEKEEVTGKLKLLLKNWEEKVKHNR